MIPKSTVTVTGSPASQNLVDLATLKSDLGIGDTSQDVRLGRIIALSSAAIAKYCGRQFIKQTYTETWRLVTSPSQAWQATVSLDPVPALSPSVWPVVSVTSITEGANVVDPAQYVIDKPIDPAQPGRGFVRLNASGAESAWSRGIVVAVYVAGFDPSGTSSPTSPMPQDLYEAALLDCRGRFNAKDTDPSGMVTSEQIADFYQATYDKSAGLQDFGGQAGTYGIPVAALTVLDAYRLPNWA